MADLAQYEHAIIVSFQILQHQGHQQQQVANEATQYCHQIETSPLGWRLTLQLLSTTSRSEVKFFCLQSMQKLLNDQAVYAQLSPDQQIQLRSMFMDWIRSTSTTTAASGGEEKYIRAKVGVVLALLAKQQYPQNWPNAFDEMLDLLRASSSPTVAERLVLMLSALDEEVVSHGGPEAMEIKDAMRISVVFRLIPSLGDICRAFAEINLDLVNKCWQVIGLYAVWVDISLTTEESFLRLWLEHCLDPRFRLSALGALNKLVEKGMDPDSKLKLISQLGLVDCCLDACCPNHATFAPLPSIWTTLKQQQPPGMVTTVLNESSDEFELESAKFCACLGSELLFCRKATGDIGYILLRPLMERILYCLFVCMRKVDKYDIQQEVLEFANKIIISNQPSGGGGGTMEIDFFAPNVVQSMFLAVLSCIRLPKDHNMSELLNGGGGNGVVEEDLEEEDFREHRSSVKRLFLNLVRCAGAGQILPMLQHLVHTCFDTQHNIESILYLVYAFGEAAPEISSMLKKNAQPNPDPLVQQLLINFDLLLVSIFQSPAFQNHVSAVVAIMYNELAARYTFNLRMHTCLPGIIQHICGLGGVHHSHCIVRSKAASLLLRMIRQLDLLCAPLCVPVLTSLQDVITNGLSFDVCLREPRRNRLASPAGGLSPVRSNQDSYYGSGGGVILAVPDALLIYEVVGFMLGNPALWSEEHIRRAYLTHVIQGTLEHSLQLACNSLHKTSHNNGAGHRYARANEDVTYWGACQLEALASVCKGFALQSNETIIALWRNVLRTGLIATVTFLKTGSADEDVLLNGLRRLCHALIRTLGVEILVFFPDICQCLLQETPNADICRALPLLNQMMSAFRGRMHDALAQSLLPILRATNSRIAPIANLSQHTTHDMVELFAMEKELFTFLFTIASNELSPVFYHELNINNLHEVLVMLVDGLRSVQDAGVQKVCAQTLLALCKEWLSATPLPAAPLLQQHFYQFTLESVTPASFEATMQPHFDAKDAACSQLLLQICLLHLALCELLGTRWVEYLSTVYLAPKCNQEVVQEYCTALQLCKNSPKELRQKFQKLFLVRGGE